MSLKPDFGALDDVTFVIILPINSCALDFVVVAVAVVADSFALDEEPDFQDDDVDEDVSIDVVAMKLIIIIINNFSHNINQNIHTIRPL